MASVRWGIIGTGNICSDFVQALRSTEGACVAAVAARTPESAQKFAEANGIPASFGSYDELVACAEIDVLYVGTIHPKHKGIVLKALAAKKHVLCEKPMTCCQADTAELVAAAREHGVLLAEAMWTRFFPVVRQARELIAAGAIGEVLQMHGDFGFRFPGLEDKEVKHRLTDPDMAGGATLDIGVYPIACMLLAFGPNPPTKLTAVGTLTETGVDKNVSVSAVSGNKVASMTWSIECQTPEEWRILGTTGSIVFEGPAHCPLRMKLTRLGAGRMDPPTEEVFTTPQPILIDGAQPLNFPGSEGFVFQAAAVTAAVREGLTEMPEFSLEESVTMAGICDEILKQVGVVHPETVFG